MTCTQCGAHAHGDLCVDCRLDRAAENADVDDTDYECPDCGGETSGPDVTCYKCRDSHQPVEDDENAGKELVADGGVDVDALRVGDAFETPSGTHLVVVGIAPSAPSHDAPLYEIEQRRPDGRTTTTTYGPHNLNHGLAGGIEYIGTLVVSDAKAPFWCAGCERPKRHEDERWGGITVDKAVCSYGCGERVVKDRLAARIGGDEPVQKPMTDGGEDMDAEYTTRTGYGSSYPSLSEGELFRDALAYEDGETVVYEVVDAPDTFGVPTHKLDTALVELRRVDDGSGERRQDYLEKFCGRSNLWEPVEVAGPNADCELVTDGGTPQDDEFDGGASIIEVDGYESYVDPEHLDSCERAGAEVREE